MSCDVTCGLLSVAWVVHCSGDSESLDGSAKGVADGKGSGLRGLWTPRIWEGA